MMYKLRRIVQDYKYPTFGITIPSEVSLFFDNCFFSIQKSGTCIILTSGTNFIPTKEEIKNYAFEDCRI